MAKNIVVRKKQGDKWEELHPATNAGNVALASGKTVQTEIDEHDQLITQVNSRTKIKTYSDFSHLGLNAGEETIDSIVNAMPYGSIGIFVTNSASNLDQYPDGGYGVLRVYRLDNSRTHLEFVRNSVNKKWVGVYYNGNTPAWSGWSCIITENESSKPNMFINGNFDVWQDGEGAICTSYSRKYTADGWSVQPEGCGCNVNRSVSAGENTLKLEITEPGNIASNVRQYLEEIDYKNLAGKTVKLTIDMYTDTDFENQPTVYGQSQASGITYYSDRQQTVKVGRYKYTHTFKFGYDLECGNFMQFQVLRNITKDWQGVVRIYSAKLEIGEIATPIVPKPYGEELARCQRYFETGGTMFCSQFNTANVALLVPALFKVEKRVKPTMKFTHSMDKNVDSLEVDAPGTKHTLFKITQSNIGDAVRTGISWSADARI